MERVFLNDHWRFSERFEEQMLEQNYNDEAFATVRLPHTVKELPFHYFDEGEYQMESCYRRSLNVPNEWKGKHLLLTIDGAAHFAKVYVNGCLLKEHACGYTAFTTDISDAVCYGQENVIAIYLDSRESLNVPPFGFVVDYMTYGGLTREVYLDIKDATYIEDIFLKSEKENENYSLQSKVKLANWNKNCKATIRQTIRDSKEEHLIGTQTFEVDSFEVSIIQQAPSVVAWSVSKPKLYEIKTELLMDGTCVDEQVQSFGFRTVEFKSDGIYLNGEKLKIRGLNRHQSYPYVGYAMPKSMQKLDADILKKELGCNAVRTSHYPQSHHFIDRCDELGLLVFMEFPGWQHIGDAAWKEQALVNLEEMITQYRNHTSIVLWGVRINESVDDDEFYQRTNELAHRLDDSRQTGGVRAHKKSHLFEDVYTYNDFLHDGSNNGCEPKKKVTSDMNKGYLVSEYNGHMYPTKAYDWEEHRVEHALRHAKVLDAVKGQDDIAGSFGWCMFDYNTHKDFGSGDRICYHGVMDMFRNPKLASLIYACENNEKPVLELSSTMDIGEHPGCNRGLTYIFSNADSVKMYKNDTFIKEYKNDDSPYNNLLHGPMVIDDFIGDQIHKNEGFTKKQADIIKEALNYVALHGYHFPPRIVAIALWCMLRYGMKPTQAVSLYNKYIGDWGGTSTVYRFEAIRDGKVVKTMVKEPMHKIHLDVSLSSSILCEKETYDVAELRIVMRDENNNQLYFYNDPIVIETDGPIEVIGPKVVGMQGGMTGVYVKTTGESGKAKVIVQADPCDEVTVELEIQI